jgi:hypothetical protein
MLALAIASALLIGAVQCGYNARQYLWSPTDIFEWWPEISEDEELQTILREEQAEAFQRWEVWGKWTAILHFFGILALLAGLGLALLPPHSADAEASLRWTAAAIAFAACFGEVLGLAVGYKRKTIGAPAAVRRRYCPACHLVLRHHSLCRYRETSVAEAWRLYSHDQQDEP